MCGLVGFISSSQNVIDELELVASSMALAIASRGPDDDGIWTTKNATKINNSKYSTNFIVNSGNDKSQTDYGLALGFRRLSILDLTNAGHQPMTSPSERYVITFNGEIYNHNDLRSLFPKTKNWTGHSDTETLLACFELFGIIETLKKTVGMFSIAVWDKELEILHLTRDRFGEKPLYYGWTGVLNGSIQDFVFGSELKALRAFPGFSNLICRDALALFMKFTYVPSPYSIHEGIFKLEPGCILSINTNKLINLPPLDKPIRPGSEQGALSMHRWWSLANVVQTGSKNLIGSEIQAINMLEECLFESVKIQSIADVPLGAFLSGGIDSSTIVALMQSQSKNPVKTFTIGFEEAGFDESKHAKAVAKHLKTDHTEVFVTSRETLDLISDLPIIFDEPFADSSQIPTHLVCKLAKAQVTVALSGDGGDELFGGYNRYLWGSRIWKRLDWMPYQARLVLGSSIQKVPKGAWNFFGSTISSAFQNSTGNLWLGDKAHKLANRLKSVRNIDELYVSLVSEWQDPSLVVKKKTKSILESFKLADTDPSTRSECILDDALPLVGTEEHQLRMMYRDSMTYLPDDILCKVDRSSMACSLETRVPFLDHRVAELAWRLPLDMKIRNGQGKWALRQVLYKYVPKELIDRPKAGFGVPVGQWLRGPLREWAEELLKTERLQLDGYFYPEPIRMKWQEHLSGKFDHTASIWTVLMFQSWLDIYKTTKK